MDDKWISAAEAYDRVGKVNPFRAAEAICSRAHDGIITARAHMLILGDRRIEDANVPADFWWARGHAALTQKWASGDFETWIDSRIHCRAYGVTFLERDIEAMLPPGRTVKVQQGASGSGNFASASRCIDELCKQLDCNEREAAEHIIRFCRARLVESRCASFWCEVTDRYGANEEELSHVAIPAWFWEHCASGREAILDWQAGTFAGRGYVDGEMHKVRIKGAEFDVAGIVELEAMLRNQEQSNRAKADAASRLPPSLPSEPIARGGRPKSENWTNWIAELVSYIHEEGIPAGSGVEGQDAIIGAIEQRLLGRDLECLGRSTVQSAVRAVLVRLRSAEN